MSDDKRPKASIDMTAESRQPPFRPALSGGQASKPKDGPLPKPGRRGLGFLGYVVAGLFGGIATAGGLYVASTQHIAGFSLTDPKVQHQIKELQDRTVFLENAARTARAAPPSGYPAASQGPEGLNELRSRLDAMVTAGRDLDGTVQALNQEVQSLTQKVQSAEHRPGGQSKSDVEAEIAAQTAPIAQRLSSAERQLDVLARLQNERQSDARTAALTLALTNLKRAVADGRPFPSELAAVETLSPAKLPVSQISTYKDQGIPSLATLQSEFADASRKTIEKSNSNKANGFMGEMLSRAKSAIQIKPADSSGSTVEDIVGRMGTALKAGDVKGALLQGAKLENPPQEMMDWFEKAQARVTADETLRKTDQDLLASLTKATARRQ